MSKPVIISTESTCDLGAELVERYQIHVIPLHVTLDGNDYLDGVNITADDIYRVFDEKGVLPQTSALNLGEYEDRFRGFTEQGYEVVHISLGSALSTTCRNAVMAAEEVGGVYVVDSGNLSTGIGQLVLEAADRAAAGMPAERIAAELEELRSHVSTSFVLDTLEFMHKGGRCSGVAVLGANLLKLKPSIVVDNADGRMTVGKKYRGTLEKALEQYVADQLQGRTDLRLKRIFITHSGISEERVALVRRAVEACADFEEILVTQAGCTISSHCGPNCLGVLFLTK